MSEAIAITGEANIAAFQLLRVRRGLKLEIETTMKLSRAGSIMQLAAHYCGSTKRTKRGVYADYDAWMVSMGFDSVPLRQA
jgi:hypothetical protein